jgi:hypothetical protein
MDAELTDDDLLAAATAAAEEGMMDPDEDDALLLAAMDAAAELADEELLAAVAGQEEREEQEMDPTEDDELLTALDAFSQPAAKKNDLEAWQYAPEYAKRLMSNRPAMREVHELIDDVMHISRWPDVHYDYFYGLRPLNNKGRYTMAAYFWYNGLDPKLGEEWFQYMGAFCEPHGRRRDEFRSVIKALDDSVKTPEGREKLLRWHVFDCERCCWTTCWAPTLIHKREAWL